VPSLFNAFKEKVLSAVYPESGDKPVQPSGEVDNLISLGVLLWEVAQADDHFLPEEESRMKQILSVYGKISDDDMPIVLRAVKEASIERIDLYSFTKEVSLGLDFKAKIEILKELFRVACSDNDLDETEHEMIRKISGLLQIEHQYFIDSKIAVKKEFGMDTAGL